MLAAVVDDDHQPVAAEAVGEHHRALVDGAHRRPRAPPRSRGRCGPCRCRSAGASGGRSRRAPRPSTGHGRLPRKAPMGTATVSPAPPSPSSSSLQPGLGLRQLLDVRRVRLLPLDERGQELRLARALLVEVASGRQEPAAQLDRLPRALLERRLLRGERAEVAPERGDPRVVVAGERARRTGSRGRSRTAGRSRAAGARSSCRRACRGPARGRRGRAARRRGSSRASRRAPRSRRARRACA